MDGSECVTGRSGAWQGHAILLPLIAEGVGARGHHAEESGLGLGEGQGCGLGCNGGRRVDREGHALAYDGASDISHEHRVEPRIRHGRCGDGVTGGGSADYGRSILAPLIGEGILPTSKDFEGGALARHDRYGVLAGCLQVELRRRAGGKSWMYNQVQTKRLTLLQSSESPGPIAVQTT